MRMPRLSDAIHRLRRRSLRQEQGFTVVELAAAMAILLIALTALARTATVAFSDVSNARQRQTGNQLANQLLEEVRGLPFDTVKKGLSSSDLAGDSSIVACSGGVYRYVSCAGERIVHTPGLANSSPLVPHRATVGPPQFPSTYSYRTYVTEATGVPSQGAYRVTVIVDWEGAARTGLRSDLEVQTLVYSPQGCVDTASHPFGAPCQPYYYGAGTTGGGSFIVSGPFGDGGGADYDEVSGSFMAGSADAQSEQISLVQGNVTLPEISQIVDGVQTTVSSAGTFSSADSDPGTPSATYDSQT
ncbi:MAG: prepilin-type N-terminal cleavage/methylation domain-containing protein, partial [Actinomycetota bacterium]|nr:prepilin-type N-terminal cleavage/methylation domain-containing protein [Actinomycetota bacterium]